MFTNVAKPMAEIRSMKDIQVGNRAGFEVTITDALLEAFAQVSGDYNPLHFDESYAKSTQFGGRVVHGLLVSSLFSRLVGMYLPGRNSVYLSQTVHFLKPVHLREKIEISGEVIHKSEASQTVTLRIQASRKGGEIVVEGEAKVMVLETTMVELPRVKPVSLDFSGQIVLVTGSSRGIGAAIAMLFAYHGAAVALNYRSSRAQADEVVSKIKAAGKSAQTFQADITDVDQVRGMIRQIREKFGAVTILVNNASGDVLPKPFSEMTEKDFEKGFDVTLTGAYHIIQAVLPGMLTQKHGKIINVGTAYTISAPPDKISRYVVAKHALVGLTKALAVELGPKGIRVNMVAPGLTETSLTAHLPRRIKDLAAFQTPLHRNATPEDTARVVLFLASEMAEFVNGVILPVTGGSVML
jgi:3-oxoacyl-[acyl-carrier protein] reductase